MEHRQYCDIRASVYTAVFEILDNEPDVKGMDAGYVAAKARFSL